MATTSTLQIKRGTGSAVPSGLSDGELAVNLDNNKIYFGSGSVSKNYFHFTNVTASSDISSSGIITAEHFESSDDITAAGTITGEQITSTDDASIAGDLILGDSIIHSGDLDTKIEELKEIKSVEAKGVLLKEAEQFDQLSDVQKAIYSRKRCHSSYQKYWSLRRKK